jgi:hypothetical protein
MKFSSNEWTSLEDLSSVLRKKGIDNTLEKELLMVEFKGKSYVIVKEKDENQFNVYKPASGMVCIILAAIPAAICYVIIKFSFKELGFWLALVALIPFAIFQRLFQSLMTVNKSNEIELLVKEILDIP